ncbi:hypothetical protein [Kangiella taiwanensis]|uniref:Uncharacterized protein n=1 Tax=Kangiella taiwanensis TaxID=1079179 RepID=A0ABP8I6B3_9GAMM|nr:hypothetical protein [Kangiella taiwanensis]
MQLPILTGKPLLFLKIFYVIAVFSTFLLITLYWLLGLIFTTSMIFSEHFTFRSEILLLVAVLILGGTGLISFLLLNLNIFSQKKSFWHISKKVHFGVAVGCSLSGPLILYYGLGFIPIMLVALAYYFAKLNNKQY